MICLFCHKPAQRECYWLMGAVSALVLMTMLALSGLVILASMPTPQTPPTNRLLLHGTLFATEQQAEQGEFVLETDLGSLELTAQDQIRDWLDGTVGHQVELEIRPK